ncbi:MAG: protein kinase [Peptostreptococcus sp.]|uniref:protein kinase domain-containing protein n=1 Tax=Peptostreptococcus sp. TaxID=1262 RepID=UPI002FC94D07
MARKADVKGGNGDIIFNIEAGTARKYLRNTSTLERVQRFKRELDLFQEICKHPIPNVVEVLDVYINNDKVSESYIEMKKYDGSLYDILEITRGNVKISFELILPVIKALHTLCEGNPPIYHRDIKPDNILLLKVDNVYTLHLTDFGTCFLNDGSERITPDNIAVGPRMFIAPEYEKGRVEAVTEKGDIFSIGKVIWCMINGVEDDFMPSNFWFVKEYDLTKRFPDNFDMVIANTIIASCLNINPNERSNYSTLIKQIENYSETGKLSLEEERQYKVKLYQEKRGMELLEIKEKNRLLVNNFSQCFVKALAELAQVHPGFDLIEKLNEEYCRKSKDGIDYTSINVEDNSAHYLYDITHDRIYFSINYNPAHGEERYCNVTIWYKISTSQNGRTIRFSYAENGSMICDFNGISELLDVSVLEKIMNSIIDEYIE